MVARRASSARPLDPRVFELEADRIRVLANPKRLMIVSVLGEGPATVSQLADRLALSLQNISQHLRVMRDRNLVRSERAGREVRYALTSPVFSECCALVRTAILEETRLRRAEVGRAARYAWPGAEEPGRPMPVHP